MLRNLFDYDEATGDILPRTRTVAACMIAMVLGFWLGFWGLMIGVWMP